MSLPRLVCAVAIASCLAQPSHSQQATGDAAAKPKVEAQTTESVYPLDKLTEFSATMVGGIVGNIDETRIYRSGNLMRTDMLDGKSYMVTNLEHYDTFAGLPEHCMHDASPALNTFPFTAVRPGNRVERNPIGTEVVDGHTCRVEEVTITSEHGKNLKLKLWEADDLSGFPLKVEVYRRTGPPITLTYKDIKIGKPDPALFAHPATCTAPPTNAKSPTTTKKKSPGSPSKSPPQK